MSENETRNDPAPPSQEARSGDEDRLLAFADRLRRREEDVEHDDESPEIWVAFHLARRGYALPVTHVYEFAKIGTVTRVPGAPSSVRGVASLRGHAIPIVDLKESLGLSIGEGEEAERVLVVDHRGRRIGLIVDRVDRVFKLLPSAIKKVPATSPETASGRIVGFYEADGEDLALLDAERFLTRSEETTSRSG